MKMYLTMMAASCSRIIWIAVVIATKKFVRQSSSLMGVTKNKMFAGICVKIFQDSDLSIMEPTSWLIRVLIISFENVLSQILIFKFIKLFCFKMKTILINPLPSLSYHTLSYIIVDQYQIWLFGLKQQF